MAKYVVVLVVVLFAAHLLLSRSRKPEKQARSGRLRSAVESTLRKAAIAVGGLLAVLVVIVLVKHMTS